MKYSEFLTKPNFTLTDLVHSQIAGKWDTTTTFQKIFPRPKESKELIEIIYEEKLEKNRLLYRLIYEFFGEHFTNPERVDEFSSEFLIIDANQDLNMQLLKNYIKTVAKKEGLLENVKQMLNIALDKTEAFFERFLDLLLSKIHIFRPKTKSEFCLDLFNLKSYLKLNRRIRYVIIDSLNYYITSSHSKLTSRFGKKTRRNTRTPITIEDEEIFKYIFQVVRKSQIKLFYTCYLSLWKDYFEISSEEFKITNDYIREAFFKAPDPKFYPEIDFKAIMIPSKIKNLNIYAEWLVGSKEEEEQKNLKDNELDNHVILLVKGVVDMEDEMVHSESQNLVDCMVKSAYLIEWKVRKEFKQFQIKEEKKIVF